MTVAIRLIPVERHSRTLTREQILRRRNDEWRIDHDEGRRDPYTGRIKKRSLALIAELYGVDKVTVFDGIVAARAIREALDREDVR